MSKSYHEDNIPAYSFINIILSYCENFLKKSHEITYQIDTIKNLYNINEMTKIIIWTCERKHIPYNENDIKEHLLLNFIIQVLTANSDNASVNHEIYEENELCFSPFFDFEHCGEINLRKKSSKNKNYCFAFYTDRSESRPENYIETIKHFKNFATKQEMELLRYYLEELKRLKMKDQFTELEEQINANVPILIKAKLKDEIQKNLESIDTILGK